MWTSTWRKSNSGLNLFKMYSSESTNCRKGLQLYSWKLLFVVNSRLDIIAVWEGP